MSSALPHWVAQARGLPIAFAQVREDPDLDVEIAARAGENCRIMMVASGGCTACALAATAGVGMIHLVDPNPAQIALTRLKLALLARTGPEERLALLGHLPMAQELRRTALVANLTALGLDADALGPLDIVAELGPDHAGRYECLFAELRKAMRAHAEDLETLLMLDDPAEQSRRVDPTTALGHALDRAFQKIMALPNLVGLFGTEATRNRLAPFAAHFVDRTRAILATQPARGNPFLAQMLLGRFTADSAHRWLEAPRTSRMPTLRCDPRFMVDALEDQSPLWDVVHLSNILDWLSPDAARATLALAWSALRPGGWVVIRQLNSSLDVVATGPRFTWDKTWGENLLRRDRSFFYRAIHLGRKP